MLSKFQREQINKELKAIVAQYGDAYRMLCDGSRVAYMKTLAPGAPVPKEGVIYGEEERQQFKAMCDGYRANANAILADVIDNYRKIMTEAPTTEAVNTVSLLNLRSTVTADEINDLLDRYGENVQAFRAISSVATEKGLKEYEWFMHPVESDMQKAEDLSKALDRALSDTNANAGHASNGYLDIINMQIDNTFPADGE